jgi:hypothetical protein
VRFICVLSIELLAPYLRNKVIITSRLSVVGVVEEAPYFKRVILSLIARRVQILTSLLH